MSPSLLYIYIQQVIVIVAIVVVVVIDHNIVNSGLHVTRVNLNFIKLKHYLMPTSIPKY